LTDRDIQVLAEIATGKGRDEVARSLHMSSANVAYHLRRISSKLKVRGQGGMVAAALVAGVLASDRWPVASTGLRCLAALFDIP